MYSPQQQQYMAMEPFPYKQATDYSDLQTISNTFPHLGNINQPIDWLERQDITGIVIRSANDDNVHKAIKYGIWTTTAKNRAKLNQLYIKSKSEGKEVYLFFSVVKSGMFEGVAKLTSGLIEETFPYWWEDFTHKFKDYFQIQWVYIKDVNFFHFSGLANTENQDVCNSKDCDTIDLGTTQRMLDIYARKKIKNKWIFNDFQFMDTRQKQYTRINQNPYYQYPQQQQQQYGYAQNMVYAMGNGVGGYDMMMMPQNNNYVALAPHLLKPIGPEPRADLGFQKNPVSKNRKK